MTLETTLIRAQLSRKLLQIITDIHKLNNISKSMWKRQHFLETIVSYFSLEFIPRFKTTFSSRNFKRLMKNSFGIRWLSLTFSSTEIYIKWVEPFTILTWCLVTLEAYSVYCSLYHRQYSVSSITKRAKISLFLTSTGQDHFLKCKKNKNKTPST